MGKKEYEEAMWNGLCDPLSIVDYIENALLQVVEAKAILECLVEVTEDEKVRTV